MDNKKDKIKPDWGMIVLVSLIVMLGFGLRIWGIGWSLPDQRHPVATYHPDELVNLGAALQVDIPHGKFDTGFYSYGAFYFYLVGFAHTFARGYHLIPVPPNVPLNVPPPSELELLKLQAPEQAGLFLVGRIVTVLLGTITIAVIFALGNRLFDKRVGFFAAFLYAVIPLAVIHSHFLTVDVPATFFVALSLLWAARLADEKVSKSWKDYVCAGVWVGLATATKYNTLLVIVALLWVLWGKRKEPTTLKYSGMLLGAVAVTFLVACPGIWLNWKVFWEGAYPGSGVRYELLEHPKQGHGALFVETGLGWWYHLTVSLPFSLGTWLFWLMVVSVIAAVMRSTPQDKLLLVFLVVFLGVAGFSTVRFARYLIPLYPVLCVLMGRFVFTEFDEVLLRTPVVVFGVGVGVFTLWLTFQLVYVMTLPDPRDRVADYLEKNARPGASIAFAKIPWFFSPPLSPRWGMLMSSQRQKSEEEVTRFKLLIPFEEWGRESLDPVPDYIILSNFETMHEVTRLHREKASDFMKSIPMGMNKRVFSSSFRFGDYKTVVPEDLLYITPEITVYQK